MKLLSHLHARFGDFWWYSLLLFVAFRCGDVINAVVGLWLVPKYVPQSDLGAVVPLLQVTAAFGLPISILVVTFTKFLNEYRTKGEEGKVKSLIRIFWFFSVAAISVGSGLAMWLMPHFFERIRVANGSLGVLIIATAVLSTTAPVFMNALQALKKFNALTVINLASAPLRLAVMLVAMPFRALSGYMLGQAAPYVFQIGWSVFSLRKEICSEVPSKPFWREDWRRIVRFTLLMGGWSAVNTVTISALMMIVRQRFPESESAAYYIISRFAELTTYAGASVVMVMFPLAAEASVKAKDSLGLVLKSLGATLVFGLICTMVLAFAGKTILSACPIWSSYVGYVPDMAILALVQTLGYLCGVFCTFEIATGRFSFLRYAMPLSILQCAFFVCLSGYAFFEGIFPANVVEMMAGLKIHRLRNFLWAYLGFNFLFCLFIGLHLLLRMHSTKRERRA